jgi:hypothetical protein
MVSWAGPKRAANGDEIMAEKTCAACDCKLDESAIKVNIGARVVEVCCEDCARKLREAKSGENP